MPVPIILRLSSSIHFSHHDIYAAQNDHDVSHSVSNAHVFQNSEVDEAGRTNSISIRICRPIADQEKSKLALRSFDPAIGFSGGRTERAHLHLGIHDRARSDLGKGLLQNLDALAHL